MVDLDRVEELLDGTPYMRREKAELLNELFTRLRPQKILECGTYHGAGTCYLATMSAAYGGHVTTIDLPWTLTKAEHQPKVEQLVERCSLTNVDIVRRDDGAEGWFRNYFEVQSSTPEVIRSLDFVYIDGGHNWQCVVSQFAMAYRALKLGGWLVCDDIRNDKYPDVGLAWRQIIRPSVSLFREHGNWGFAMRGAG